MIAVPQTPFEWFSLLVAFAAVASIFFFAGCCFGRWLLNSRDEW